MVNSCSIYNKRNKILSNHIINLFLLALQLESAQVQAARLQSSTWPLSSLAEPSDFCH